MGYYCLLLWGRWRFLLSIQQNVTQTWASLSNRSLEPPRLAERTISLIEEIVSPNRLGDVAERSASTFCTFVREAGSGSLAMVLGPAHWFGRRPDVAVPILSAPWLPLRYSRSCASQPVPPASACGPDCGITYEADPQFLEHACPRAARPTATALVGMRKACEASGLKQPAAFVNFALDAAKSRHMVRYRAPGA